VEGGWSEKKERSTPPAPPPLKRSVVCGDAFLLSLLSVDMLRRFSEWRVGLVDVGGKQAGGGLGEGEELMHNLEWDMGTGLELAGGGRMRQS